jgi:ABC-type transport system substrate-binding protein
LKLLPGVAEAMGNFSTDGKQYNITVRDDVYFHDGHRMDAWDVSFSMQMRLVPDSGASVYSNWLVPFGYDDNATAAVDGHSYHGNYSALVEDKDSDGFFEHISFHMMDTFAPLLTDTLGFSIFPEHILGDPVNHGLTGGPGTLTFDPDATWICAPTDMDSHSFNTGRPSDPGGLNGPIGVGPVYFEAYDASAGTITLKKFDGKMWDNATGTWVDNATNRFYEFKDGKWTNMPEQATVIVASMDAALADMKTGDVNIMDPQFTMSNILEELQADAAITPVLTPETGWQAIYMNPKFQQDGVYHLDKKGVRHAISHVVPREDIITYLMNGLGLPAFTPVPITSWAAIPEQEMIDYKKTLLGSDGTTTPEENATTAYDEYNLDVAFTWLDSEGYDTAAWREWTDRPEETTQAPGFEILAATFAVVAIALISRRRR